MTTHRTPPRSARLRLAALALAGLVTAGGIGLAGSASATTRPAVTASPASPSGEAMPKGSTARWRQVVAQDFTRLARLGRFAARYPGWAGYDGNRDTSRGTARPAPQVGLWSSRTTISVRDGLLDCRLHTRRSTPQVCAVTPTTDGRWWKGTMYGKYVVRFRADRTPGYKIAWLLWPQSDDWNEGEVDFPEGSLTGTITGAAHEIGDPEWAPQYVDTGVTMTGWHTATIVWKPGRLTFRLDGRRWTTTDPAVVPRTPMRWALQAETRISKRPPKRTTEGRIQIDWVAVYRWRG